MLLLHIYIINISLKHHTFIIRNNALSSQTQHRERKKKKAISPLIKTLKKFIWWTWCETTHAIQRSWAQNNPKKCNFSNVRACSSIIGQIRAKPIQQDLASRSTFHQKKKKTFPLNSCSSFTSISSISLKHHTSSSLSMHYYPKVSKKRILVKRFKLSESWGNPPLAITRF